MMNPATVGGKEVQERRLASGVDGIGKEMGTGINMQEGNSLLL